MPILKRHVRPWHSTVIRLLIGLAGALTALILFGMAGAAAKDPSLENLKNRAVILMATGLYLVWCVGAMRAMHRWRSQVRTWFHRVPGNTWVKFFFFCLLLICLEEVVTVTMTNLAPAFGSQMGKAYITGSSNYFETILWHSVVALFPTYIAWTLVVRKVAIHPNTAYLFYGFQGVLGEAMYGGPSAFLSFAFWISVYGPAVYLPAYCVYGLGEARKPKVRHFAVIFVLSCILTIPSALFVNTYRPTDAGFPEVIKKDQAK